MLKRNEADAAHDRFLAQHPRLGPRAAANATGASEGGHDARSADVLAAQQLAACRTPPAQHAAQLHHRLAASVALTRLQAATQCAAAPNADRSAIMGAVVAACRLEGLDPAKAAQIAWEAADLAVHQTMPATGAVPAQVDVADGWQGPFPGLKDFDSIQQVWDMLTKGGNGSPSLFSLEDASRNRWRKGRDAEETRYYSRQWGILKAFSFGVTARAGYRAETHSVTSPNQVIAELDAARAANGKSVTSYVHKIAKEYRAARA